MFLFITGRNRKIYFTKDNTAFYKSKKNNVDVTYMFKKTKNRLELKKKYLKTGGGIGPNNEETEETEETKETKETEEIDSLIKKIEEYKSTLGTQQYHVSSSDDTNIEKQLQQLNSLIKEYKSKLETQQDNVSYEDDTNIKNQLEQLEQMQNKYMVEEEIKRILIYLKKKKELSDLNEIYSKNTSFMNKLQIYNTKTNRTKLGEYYPDTFNAYTLYTTKLQILAKYKDIALKSFDNLICFLETTKTLLYPKQVVKKFKQQIEEKILFVEEKLEKLEALKSIRDTSLSEELEENKKLLNNRISEYGKMIEILEQTNIDSTELQTFLKENKVAIQVLDKSIEHVEQFLYNVATSERLEPLASDVTTEKDEFHTYLDDVINYNIENQMKIKIEDVLEYDNSTDQDKIPINEMKEILKYLIDTNNDVKENIYIIINNIESGSSSKNLLEKVKKDIAQLIKIVDNLE